MTNSEQLGSSVSSQGESNLPKTAGTALVLTGVFTALEARLNALGLPANYEMAASFFSSGATLIGVGALSNLFHNRRNKRGQSNNEG